MIVKIYLDDCEKGVHLWRVANSPKTRRRPAARSSAITDSQLEVLRAFRDYVNENKVSPSLRDLADVCHVSAPTISGYLQRLGAAGYLSPSPARYRPWLLNEKGRRAAAKANPK
jgi:DNA-binding MarR family transcriptional regulator